MFHEWLFLPPDPKTRRSKQKIGLHLSRFRLNFDTPAFLAAHTVLYMSQHFEMRSKTFLLHPSSHCLASDFAIMLKRFGCRPTVDACYNGTFGPEQKSLRGQTDPDTTCGGHCTVKGISAYLIPYTITHCTVGVGVGTDIRARAVQQPKSTAYKNSVSSVQVCKGPQLRPLVKMSLYSSSPTSWVIFMQLNTGWTYFCFSQPQKWFRPLKISPLNAQLQHTQVKENKNYSAVSS